MNIMLKQWITHPVLLGAIMGVLIGSTYLIFNSHLEDEGGESPINVAQNATADEAKVSPRHATGAIKFHYDKLEESLEESHHMPLASQVPQLEIKPEKQETHALAIEDSVELAEKPLLKSLDKTEQSLLEAKSEQFTIQLLGARSEQNVKQFIHHHGLDKKAHYVHTKLGQKDWFVVLYGTYASPQEAKAALLTMPLSLKEEGVQPWVRSMVSVEEDMKQMASR